MDMNALKGLLTMPSLASYLGRDNGTSGLFDTVSQGLTTKIAAAQSKIDNDGGGSQGTVTLSDEAKALLEAGNGSDGGKLSGTQKAAQNFLMTFFDQSGIDFEKLSPDAVKFLAGLQDVIAGTSANIRDHATDLAEAKYSNGTKQAYTLAGNGSRLRIGIEYDATGKPLSLSVTDITGSQVETASIRLVGEAKSGAAISIERTQREYAHGHMTKSQALDPLEIGLYQA